MVGKIVGFGEKAKHFIDGKRVSRAQFFRAFPAQRIGDGSGLIGWKPLASLALAVHKRQIPQARARAEKHGIPTDFTTDGRPILRTREHRKKYMAMERMHDEDGGYGDG